MNTDSQFFCQTTMASGQTQLYTFGSKNLIHSYNIQLPQYINVQLHIVTAVLTSAVDTVCASGFCQVVVLM